VQTVFLTGVSGYAGSRLARALAARDDVDRLVGLDLRAPRDPPAKLEMHLGDVREPFDALLHGVDCAVHLAFVLNPTRDARMETEVNLGGTRRFLDACIAARVPHVVAISSTTAYGASAENPVPLTEADLVRPDQAFRYAAQKAQMEGLFRQVAELHPEIAVTVLRPCVIVGPGADNFIIRSLDRRVSPLMPGHDPPWQLLHEDDLVDALVGVVTRRIAGTFNVTPEGTLLLSEIATRLGARIVRLPAGVTRAIAGAAFGLGLSPLTQAPPSVLPFLTFPWVADGSRLREALGHGYAHDTASALEAYRAARAANGPSGA